MELDMNEMLLLIDILDNHLEGMDQARECMIEDPVSFRDIETFTETMQQHDIDVEVVKRIKQKVIDEYRPEAGDD